MSSTKPSPSAAPLRKLLLVNALLILLVLELVPLLFFGFSEGRWSYGSAEGRHLLRERIELLGIRDSEDAEQRDEILNQLHPFFGYVVRSGLFSDNPHGLRVNNYGFYSHRDYPIPREDERQFFIAILGGSVAADVSNHEQIFPGQPGSMIHELKQLPELAERDVVILNLASGGYKQPQQVLILSYFLSIGQEFDAIVNVDGFNEVALSPLNQDAGLPVAMPSAQHILPLSAVANADAELAMHLARLRVRKVELLEDIDALEQAGLAFAYALRRIRVQRNLKRYSEEVERVQQQSTLPAEEGIYALARDQPPPTDKEALKQMIDLWANASKMIHDQTRVRGIPYLHVLQPNQYHPTARKFTEYEQSIFGNMPYIDGVLTGYPLLLERMKELQDSGVEVRSAVNIFDQEPEGVYRDGCCHVTLRGQQILSTYIGRELRVLIGRSNQAAL